MDHAAPRHSVRRTAPPRSGAAACVLLALLCGCASVTVTRPPGAPAPRRVVVLPFREGRSPDAAWGHLFFGKVGCDRSGAVVARYLGRNLRCHGDGDVVPEAAVHRAAKALLARTPAPSEADWRRLARELGADGLVLGEVLSCRSRWFLFVSVAEVRFRVRCLDAGTGRRLWSAEAGGRRLWTFEEDLLQRHCRRIARRLTNE